MMTRTSYCVCRWARRPRTFGDFPHRPLVQYRRTAFSAPDHRNHRRSFDFSAIRRTKPFDPWLLGEMRSNHAGETGAVSIYDGALWALSVRAKARSSCGAIGEAALGGRWLEYEEHLRQFAMEHRASESEHVELLEEVLIDDERSVLLPAWKVAGFALGAISTAWCPRGMYVTTEAVEAFVEEHYGDQIRRLGEEIRFAEEKESVKDDVLVTSSGMDTTLKNQTYGGNTGITYLEIIGGKRELLLMLEYCCADEVHHKEEARHRAAEGPLPWFKQVDSIWQAFVRAGSAAAASCAKKV
eukprot:CAMPEP_0113527588 /NCGR_PEP_ID=MMETSP0015_2-20120614/1376_1 /TAXON_ID=2838 /ORGANISM="Odontella" /LENGTH=297 /DNA_ID=CAMNT_0000426033 /DNA_START=249 /DNA_END=1142 /DNA_ORIENTATION=- /assembly_acc=CAM_ASM_000160